MILQALLVTKDDETAETLIQVLAQFGVAVDRSNAADVARTRLQEERFEEVIVDFDDPEAALMLLESCRGLAGPDRKAPVTIALLHDASQIRSIEETSLCSVWTWRTSFAPSTSSRITCASVLPRTTFIVK